MCLGGYSGKVILVDIMILGHVHVLVMLTLWIFNLGTHLYHDQQRSATASLHSRPYLSIITSLCVSCLLPSH
jgi:hypothetical protein